MDSFAVQKQFVFQKEREGVYPFLLSLIAFIEENLPERVIKQPVIFKSKLIITELLTNAIKHCGEGEVLFELDVSDDLLLIKKTDTGQPFYLTENKDRPAMAWPLKSCVHNNIGIYSDGLNGLFAEVLSERKLKFYTEEYVITSEGVGDISEHYGLMIIAKLTSEFIYHFDETTGLNTFIMTLRFKQENHNTIV